MSDTRSCSVFRALLTWVDPKRSREATGWKLVLNSALEDSKHLKILSIFKEQLPFG